MASNTVTTLVDDLSGEVDASTFQFGFADSNGAPHWVEIDLAGENKNEFMEFMQRHIEAGRTIDSPVPTVAKRKSAGRSDREFTTKVREWAVANGLTVSARGRLSGEVLAAYEAANS